jgi:hypothetical protein
MNRLNNIEINFNINLEDNNEEKNIKSTNGFTTNITRDNNFIETLIKKRTSNCVMGPSSHIAAFLSSNINIEYCFKPNRQKKGRNR